MSTVEPSPEPDVFDLPAFNPRQTRQAIRRGIIHTAISAVAITLIVLFLIDALSGVIQDRSGRGDHFSSVVGTGFVVAHADYRFDNPPSCCNTGLTSMSVILEATPRTPDTSGGTSNLEVHQNLLGHLTDRPSLTQTPLIQQLAYLHDDGESTATAKAQAHKLMAALPQHVAATAVIDFANPLTQQEFTAFQRKFHLADDGAILLSAAGGQNGEGMLPVSWPGTNLAGYQHWVDGLHNGDRGNLDALSLNLTNLRHVAQTAHIYGYVVDAAPLTTLRKALDDPTTHTVRLAQAAFDLSTP